MNIDWPLPFENELVDLDEEWSCGRGTHPLGLSSHEAARKASPILARQSRAVSDLMECKHQLPASQCAWCLDVKELVHEEPWEKKDYVHTLNDVEPQGLDVEDEVPIGTVHPREIYGTQRALRIRKALLGGAK